LMAMENFAQLLAENDDGKRKNSTQELIVNNIRRLYNRRYGTDPEDISQIEAMVEDVGHTFACLQSSWDGKKLSHSTMLSYTNALLVANDLFGLDLKQTYADLETELQVRRADAQRKNPMKTTKISRVDLDEIREDLMTKGPLKSYILFYILSKYPFRLESATLRHIYYDDFIKLDDKGITNYLVVRDNESMMFSFNGYKTSKRYGSREIELDDTLIQLFSEYLEDGTHDNQYIFYPEGQGTEEKIQDKMRNNLSVWTKRLLKKYGHNASATDITKLLITEIWDNGTTQDKIKYAMWRGHEVQTAAKVYATQL
jgi:archaellum component FlaC